MKHNLPFVSVVIPAHNEEKFITKTLQSLKSQNYGGKIEIIVVDNASTDKTAKIAKRFGAKVIFENRKGVQFARQTGFEAAQGVYIASTDADSILPSNWLKQLVKALDSHSNWVAVGGWINLNKGFWVAKVTLNNLSAPAIMIFQNHKWEKCLNWSKFYCKKGRILTLFGLSRSLFNE